MKKSIPTRSYHQKARAESAAETRRRIIEVTRELLTRAPLESVSLPVIAAEADVARSTVYTIFGSREGLMVAVAEDLLDRGGFARIGEALRGPDVVRAFETSIDVAMELYSQEHEVSWALLSLAAVDRDASSAAARLNRGRRDGMIRSLANLIGVRPGFDAERVLTMRFNLIGVGQDSMPAFYDQLVTRLGSIPGATDVGLADCPPLNGGCNGTILVHRDRPAPAPGAEPNVGVHWVTPGWFTTMRVPLRSGRVFANSDRRGTQKVVVVSETAARRYWPGEDPIGRPVSVFQGGFDVDTAYVVGVVGDVRFGTLDSLPEPDVYLSYYQSARGRMMMFVRTAGDPRSVIGAVRREVAALAPGVPLYDVRPMGRRRISLASPAISAAASICSALAAGVLSRILLLNDPANAAESWSTTPHQRRTSRGSSSESGTPS